MRTWIHRLFCSTALWLCAATLVSAQDSLGEFHTNPVRFFAGNSSRTWIGRGRFMMTAYTDTVVIAADSARRALLVRRVLVNEDDTVVVSRGRGVVAFMPGDSVRPVRWTESRFPEITGRMRFTEGRWAIEFDGEWKQWSLRLGRQSDNAFTAMIGRALGALPPVMFTGLTYQAAPVTSPGKKR